MDGEAQFFGSQHHTGMTSHSLVPMAAAAADLSFDELVCRVLRGANERPLVEDIFIAVVVVGFCGGGVGRSSDNGLQTVEVNCAVGITENW